MSTATEVAQALDGKIVQTICSPKAATIFNGTYTVQNTSTVNHRTFKIYTISKDSKFAPGKRVIALLIGRNNENDYQSFGFVDDKGIYVWSRYRGTMKVSSFDYFAHLIWELATKGTFVNKRGEKYSLLIEAKCLRCNRKLTEPESIRTGIGPICCGR
jgi:hypothetical protein